MYFLSIKSSSRNKIESQNLKNEALYIKHHLIINCNYEMGKNYDDDRWSILELWLTVNFLSYRIAAALSNYYLSPETVKSDSRIDCCNRQTTFVSSLTNFHKIRSLQSNLNKNSSHQKTRARYEQNVNVLHMKVSREI